MTVYNGNLYVGGKFDSAGTIEANNLAMWNGSVWSAVGSGLKDSTIGALTVFNNQLIVGGFLGPYSKSIGIIDSWDGTKWTALGTGLTNYGKIFALTVYDSIVYAGGLFDTISGLQANDIAYWDGNSWNALGNGIFNGYVLTLIPFMSSLYAAGAFSNAGNITCNNIASYQLPNSINELFLTNSVVVYPNPSNSKFFFKIASGYQLMANSQLEIYNILGEKMYLQTLRQAQGDFAIDLSDQPEGIYLYRLIDKDGAAIASGKLVVEK
jgi:hypothetical protein